MQARSVVFGAGDGTLVFNHTDENYIFSTDITGTGEVLHLSGTTTLTGENDYTGGTTISGGTLRGNTASLTGSILNNAALAFDQTSDGTFSGVVSGTGTLEKAGAGILTFTGENTYTGATTVSAGTLRAGNATGLASGAYTLSGGTLDLNDFDLSVSGLSGVSGTVDLGSAELEVDQDGNSIFGGIISGAGSLLKLGSGMLTLTGGNTYTGLTTIRGGTLVLDGGSVDTSDEVIIGDLADTVGVMTVTGEGASLESDSNVIVGRLGEGTLNVEDGGVVTADVVIAGHLLGSDGTIRVTGTDSQVNSTSLLRIGDEGVGRLVVSGGGAVTNTSAGYIGAGTNGEGTATVTGTGSKFDNSGILYVGGEYNGAVGVLTIADEGAVNVGAGSGTVRVGHHSGATGTLNVGAASGDDAVAAGTLNAASVQFGAGTGQIVFNHLDDGHVFSGDISGAGEVLHLSGTTIMNGENTYTGGTIVSGGTLRAGGADAFTSGAYEVNGGTLDLNDLDFSISSLSGAGGTVDLGSGELEVRQEDSDGIFGGIIAGAGSLVKLGSSILTLSGASTFSGGTTLGEGTLRLEHDDAIGTGTLAVTSGIVDYDDGVDIANDIDLLANTNLNVTTGSATQSGNIGETGGSFGIVKTGNGELALTGSNSFTGGIAVNAGRLTGDTDSLVGDISIGLAVLEFSQASAGEFTGAITGTGTLRKTGEGELVFSGGIEAGHLDVHGTGAVIDGGIADIVNRIVVANFHETGETTDASLTIRGGATVTSGAGRIGDIDDFSAAVTVSGAGTTWTVGEEDDPTFFRVAGRGETSLLVEDGAEVVVLGSAAVVSTNGGPASILTVTGEDSLFDVSGNLTIGGDGTGKLIVSNGGSVQSDSAEIGLRSIRTGIVGISGEGSEWIVDGDSFVLGGNDDDAPGTGHLTLSDGGLLEVASGAGTLYAALGDGSTARINIGAAEGEDAAAAGTFDVGTIEFDGDGGGDGRLLFNHTATDYLFGAVVEGAGTIVHAAGVTTLTGASSAFTGVTSVTGGRFNVNGALGGTLEIAGARLGGSGTVGSTALLGGGILSPGNSIGTLTVAGDLDFGDGSFYEVEVNDGGFVAGTNNDFADVSGAVTINSGASLFVSAENGTDDGSTYTPDNLYTLIAADGGVSGMFGAVKTSFAFLVPELSYDTNNVFLALTQAADFEDAAVSQNQQAVAAALDALGSGNEVYDAVLLMTEEEARHTFDALTGEAHASTVTAFFLGAQQVREVLLNRLAALFGGPGNVASRDIGYAPAAGDATPGAATVWGQVFGGWGKTDEGAGTAALDRSSAGFLGGVDREIGSASRIGIAAGYSRSSFDVNGRASSGESDNFHLAGYAGTELGAVELKAALGYSYQVADTERTVLGARIKGDYDAHTVQGSTEASIGFDMGSLRLTPFAGLSVVHIETESFTETGGPAALAMSGTSNTTGITALGLRVLREGDAVDLFGSAAWRHAFGDVNSTSRAAFASNPSAPFAVRGAPLSEDVLALGAGVEIELGAASTLELSYSGELASDSRDHGLKAKLRIDF